MDNIKGNSVHQNYIVFHVKYLRKILSSLSLLWLMVGFGLLSQTWLLSEAHSSLVRQVARKVSVSLEGRES